MQKSKQFHLNSRTNCQLFIHSPTDRREKEQKERKERKGDVLLAVPRDVLVHREYLGFDFLLNSVDVAAADEVMMKMMMMMSLTPNTR